MKLTTIILVLAILQVSASSFAQKISLSERNTPINKVFDQISKQTGFDFLVTRSMITLAKPVTINVNNEELTTVLQRIFAEQPLAFTIKNQSVIVSKKEIPVISKLPYLFMSNVIKGQVSDSLGRPLIGATIQVAGERITTMVTLTDEYGTFEFIKLPEGVYDLTVSYIGYTTQLFKVALAQKDVKLNITLKSNIITLQTANVLNNGYQQISAERVTGAFDNIKKSQIEKPAANIAERLIGTTAGLEVKLDVNGNPNIQLRGKTTLNANASGLGGPDNNPLIVVDGFPITGTPNNQFGSINPNDVETITILKDAAAASIWGARASNGVIVITTKKAGQNAPLKVEFSAFTRFSPKLDVGYLTGKANAAQSVDFTQQAFAKWGGYVNSGMLYDNFRTNEAYVALSENNLGYLPADQMNARLNQLRGLDNRQQIADYLLSHPLTSQYNLSLSGGGQHMSNTVSLLAEQTQSNFRGSDNDRYAISYRTLANIYKWLDLDLSANFQYAKSRDNGVSPYEIQNLAPYEMLKNPDGSLTDIHQYYQPIMNRLVPTSSFPYSFSYNPIQEVDNRSISSSYLNARVQAGLTFKLLPGLTASSRIQYENTSFDGKSYYNDQTFYVRNRVNTTSSWNRQPDGTVTPNLPLGGFLNQNRSTTDSYIFRNVINYSYKWSDQHEINVVAGTEINNSLNKQYGYPTTYGYNDEKLSVGIFPNGATGTTDWNGYSNNFDYTNSFGYRTQRFYSLFGNAAYTYKDKYTLSASYRTDASNLIAKDPTFRYSPFYSAGLGYEISKEQFMQGISWLNRLNLRATYGRTGSIDKSTSSFTLLNLNSTPDRYTGDFTARIFDRGNPTLTWEKTRTINLGLDYNVFNNKLYGKVDYYQKTGINLLASISIPSVTGSDNASFNNASMTNKGVEVTLGTILPINNHITWNGSFNFSYNKSRVTKLFRTSYTSLIFGGGNAYREGYDPATAWVYQYAGVVDGRPKIKGPNGTLLNLTDYQSGDPREFLDNAGTYTPPYLLGITNSFKLYDFNLSFIITAKLGAVFKAQYFNYPGADSGSPNSKVGSVLNGDPNKVVPLPSDPNDFTYYGYYNVQYLDYNILSASLARLQEVNLSYNIPVRFTSKIRLRSAQVYLQGNNLYTWLANNTGEDPEYPIGTVRPKAVYTIGLKVDLK